MGLGWSGPHFELPMLVLPTTTRAGSLGGAEDVGRARIRMIMRPMRQVCALLLCIASACSMPTSAQGLEASAAVPVSLYIDGMC